MRVVGSYDGEVGIREQMYPKGYRRAPEVTLVLPRRNVDQKGFVMTPENAARLGRMLIRYAKVAAEAKRIRA